MGKNSKLQFFIRKWYSVFNSEKENGNNFPKLKNIQYQQVEQMNHKLESTSKRDIN